MATRSCNTPMSNLGIAVAIDDGLVTPVIRAAQNKSLREISEAAKDLAHRARNKRMKPEEFQGGTFHRFQSRQLRASTVSPPSSIRRRDSFSPSARSSKKPVVDDCDQIVVGHRMSIWMSCDHRVIDGALGAEYLKELRHLLENPALLLL